MRPRIYIHFFDGGRETDYIFSLNLKSVNRVFIIEPQWNPAVESQAIARAIRLGQTEQVLVIRYRVKGSIEEVS